MKHSAKILAPVISSLINNCMKDGTFPSILKTGKITPVYKKGPKDNLKNYRPVSTLPIFGKIFEKVIYSRFYKFVTSKNILSSTQFGFRKQHSTNHALHNSVE